MVADLHAMLVLRRAEWRSCLLTAPKDPGLLSAIFRDEGVHSQPSLQQSSQYLLLAVGLVRRTLVPFTAHAMRKAQSSSELVFLCSR